MNNHYSDAGDIRNGDQRHKERDNGQPPVSHAKCLTAEQLETSRVWGMKISLQMEKLNEAAACDLVRRGIAAICGGSQEEVLETPLQSLGIEDTIINILDRKFSALTVGDLLQIDRADLVAVPNLGPIRLVSLFERLAEFGITRAVELERQLKTVGDRR